MTEPSGSGASPAATPGARLAAAREALGLSIVEMAGQLRISVRQVQAIEADHYDELPGSVFVRGFIRNYARLLKLDPVPLLRAAEAKLGQDAPLRAHEISGTLPVHARHGHTKVWLAALALLVVAVLAAGGYELWQTQSERNQLPTTALPPPVTAPAAAPILPAPAPTEPPSTGMPEHAADSVAALSPDVTSNSAPGGGVAPNAAIADTHASPSQGSSRSAHITIAFERESWIEIRDNAGKLVYSGTGQANTVRSFEAAVPLEVTVGNASGVRITYNGKPFDVAAHATRNIARFTLE